MQVASGTYREWLRTVRIQVCIQNGPQGGADLTNRAAGGGIVDDYAGRVLADRYRLPLPPADDYEFAETRAFDTYSGQEVLIRQVAFSQGREAGGLRPGGQPGGVGGTRGRAGRRTA